MPEQPTVADLLRWLKKIENPDETAVYLTEDTVDEPGEFITLDSFFKIGE